MIEPARDANAGTAKARLSFVALAALAFGFFTLGGCAHPPWNPYKNWQVVRSKHITAYTNTRIRYAVTLENLDLAYAALHASMFKKRPIAPVEVVLLEQADFERLLGRYRTSISAAKLPGKGMLGRRGLLVMFGQDLSIGGAAHRMAHLFVHNLAPKAPLWLHEGLASYVETIEYRGEGKDAVACLGHLRRKHPEIELTELFSWSWKGYDESKKSSWYRQAASNLIDYFLLGEDGALRPKFGEFLGEISDGTETSVALAKVFPGLTVESLQKKARDHRSKSEASPRGLCPLPFAIPAEKQADGTTRIEPAFQGDVEEVILRLQLLPRRMGYVDWYPPEMIGLAGAETGQVRVGR